jgi:transposase, IS6 family
LSANRDLTAARSFVSLALRCGTVPVKVTTDKARFYPRVLDELVPSAQHTVEQYPTTRSKPTTDDSKPV